MKKKATKKTAPAKRKGGQPRTAGTRGKPSSRAGAPRGGKSTNDKRRGGFDLDRVLKAAKGPMRQRIEAAVARAIKGESEPPAATTSETADPGPEPILDDLGDLTRSHILARTFLEAFRECGQVRGAAASAGIDRRTHYRWLKELDGYAELFAQASEDAADILEREARRRAVDGLRSYKFTKFGEPIVHPVTEEPYYELVYSDQLLIRLLQAKRKEFAQRHEHSGPGGGPIPTETTHIYLPENGRDTPDQAGGANGA